LEGLDQIQTQLTDLKNSTSGTADKLKSAFSGVLPAFTVLGVVAGFTQMMVKGAEFGDAISLASKKTGLAVDTIQKLNYLAKTTGTSLGGLETGIRHYNSMLSDARSGNKLAIDSFNNLGLSIEDLSTMNQDQRFIALAEAIAKIEDPATRSAAAVKMLGRSGVDLIPLINSIDKIQGANIQILSQEEIDKLAAGKEGIEKMTYAWETLQNKLAATAWPDLLPMIDETGRLADGFMKIVNWLNQTNTLLKSFPQIAVPSTGFGAPFIPRTAMGGIVTSPQLRMVGEAGPEAIIPLGKMGGGSVSVTIQAGAFMGNEADANRFGAMVADVIRRQNRIRNGRTAL